MKRTETARPAAPEIVMPAVGGDGPAGRDPESDFAATPAPYPARTAEAGWWTAAVLWRARWWLVVLSLVAGGVAAAVVVRMPNWYRSETRVLLPEGGGSSLAGLVETVAPGASALIGGGDDYTRFRAILTSRTVQERIVRRFDLIDVYDLAEKPDPLGAAIRELQSHTTFEVSLEYNYLAVHVLDTSPRRAAQIADRFVEELNSENVRLMSGSAAENRQFLETRLDEAQVALDAAQGEMQGFMERNQIVGIEEQASALVQALGTAQAQVAEAEIRFQAIQSEFGPEAPEHRAAEAALATARAQMTRLTSGDEALMPVSMERLPAVGRQYARIQQEVLTQGKIIEAIRPLFEQARLTERRDANAVQIIDPATVPVEKAAPGRTVIVVVSALTAFVLAAFFALALALVRTKSAAVAEKLRQAA